MYGDDCYPRPGHLDVTGSATVGFPRFGAKKHEVCHVPCPARSIPPPAWAWRRTLRTGVLSGVSTRVCFCCEFGNHSFCTGTRCRCNRTRTRSRRCTAYRKSCSYLVCVWTCEVTSHASFVSTRRRHGEPSPSPSDTAFSSPTGDRDGALFPQRMGASETLTRSFHDTFGHRNSSRLATTHTNQTSQAQKPPNTALDPAPGEVGDDETSIAKKNTWKGRRDFIRSQKLTFAGVCACSLQDLRN